MLDLKALPDRFLKQYGRDKVSVVCGVSGAVLSMWISRKKFPIDAVQKLLEFDPTPIHEVHPLYEIPDVKPKLAILMPSNRKAESATIESLIRLYDGKEMTFKTFNFNSLYHVRNMAMGWWLRSGLEWAFWSDDDSVHACGDAKWFRAACDKPNYPEAYAGINTIYRLLHHRKKMISGCYISKKIHGDPQFAGGDTQVMKQTIARGPSQRVLNVPWCGFGCVLMHRDVPLDIIKTQPEIEVTNPYIRNRLQYDYSFFNPIEQDFGDDISFCGRAKKAGHEIFIDCSVMPGHIGNRVFTYDDI